MSIKKESPKAEVHSRVRLHGADNTSLFSQILFLLDEYRWKKTFAESGDVLTKLANKALIEYREGRTQILDPDEL